MAIKLRWEIGERQKLAHTALKTVSVHDSASTFLQFRGFSKFIGGIGNAVQAFGWVC